MNDQKEARSPRQKVMWRYFPHIWAILVGLGVSCYAENPFVGVISAGVGMMLGEFLTRVDRIWREARALRRICAAAGCSPDEGIAAGDKLHNAKLSNGQ